jgi:hypothetical protein
MIFRKPKIWTGSPERRELPGSVIILPSSAENRTVRMGLELGPWSPWGLIMSLHIGTSKYHH